MRLGVGPTRKPFRFGRACANCFCLVGFYLKKSCPVFSHILIWRAEPSLSLGVLADVPFVSLSEIEANRM